MKHIPSAFGQDRVMLDAADLARLASGQCVIADACVVSLEVGAQAWRDAFMAGARWALNRVTGEVQHLAANEVVPASHCSYPDPSGGR